jgi:hypothetical protein
MIQVGPSMVPARADNGNNCHRGGEDRWCAQEGDTGEQEKGKAQQANATIR